MHGCTPGGLLGYKRDRGVRRSLIFCIQKIHGPYIAHPKKYKTGHLRPKKIHKKKKYAQIFQTPKNTRLNLQPKKIQELKIIDPKKYVGPPPPPPPPPPSRLYLSNPPGGCTILSGYLYPTSSIVNELKCLKKKTKMHHKPC